MTKKRSLEVYKNWKRVSVAVNDLILDPQNVRLDLESSQRFNIDQGSIINDLFDNENAFQILENVVENGWFVDETPIVVRNSNKYVVIEGNRRIAALKVLQNPHLALNLRSKIRPLISNIVPIQSIYVFVAPNRASVSSLLANRHTKTTTRPWKPLRQAHFYYSQLSSEISVDDLKRKYTGVDIEKFIRMCEVHKIAASYDYDDTKINNKVREQRSFPVSTIERLYNDPNFKRYLNFDFDKDGKIKIKSSKKRFDEEFRKVILDAVERVIDTRLLNKEENREAYYNKRLNKLNRSAKHTSSDNYTPNPPKPERRRRPTGLFDRSLRSTLSCRGIERVLTELQTINYVKYPNASHDLMRSFLEGVLKEYLKVKNHTVNARRSGGYVYFDDVLKETERYFRQESNHQYRQVITELLKNKESFDTINHNPSIFSTDEKVKNAADQVSDLISFIFQDCK